jgi:predicted Zn-dependent peptidase
MSSRLFQEIREKRGLVYSIYSFNSAFRDGGIFGVYAGTGEKEAEEILPLVIEELRRLPATLSADELDRARAQARAGVLMARESTSNRAEQLAGHILVHGRPLTSEEIMRRIEAVDANQLGRVARRLMAGRPTLAAIGPLGRLARLDSVAGRLAA